MWQHCQKRPACSSCGEQASASLHLFELFKTRRPVIRVDRDPLQTACSVQWSTVGENAQALVVIWVVVSVVSRGRAYLPISTTCSSCWFAFSCLVLAFRASHTTLGSSHQASHSFSALFHSQNGSIDDLFVTPQILNKSGPTHPSNAHCLTAFTSNKVILRISISIPFGLARANSHKATVSVYSYGTVPISHTFVSTPCQPVLLSSFFRRKFSLEALGCVPTIYPPF